VKSAKSKSVPEIRLDNTVRGLLGDIQSGNLSIVPILVDYLLETEHPLVQWVRKLWRKFSHTWDRLAGLDPEMVWPYKGQHRRWLSRRDHPRRTQTVGQMRFKACLALRRGIARAFRQGWRVHTGPWTPDPSQNTGTRSMETIRRLHMQQEVDLPLGTRVKYFNRGRQKWVYGFVRGQNGSDILVGRTWVSGVVVM
jgi:hypothetical protein